MSEIAIRLGGGVIGVAIGSLIRALILRFLIRRLVGFKVYYWNCFWTDFLSFVGFFALALVSALVGIYFFSSIFFNIFAILVLQPLIYSFAITGTDGEELSFGAAFGVNLVPLAIGVAIVAAIFAFGT